MKIASVSAIQYSIIQDEIEGKYTYGLRAVSDDSGDLLYEQRDILCHRNKIERLVERLQKHDIHPLHLPDIIEDFLEEQEP